MVRPQRMIGCMGKTTIFQPAPAAGGAKAQRRLLQRGTHFLESPADLILDAGVSDIRPPR